MATHYRAISFDMDSTLVEADWFSLMCDAVRDVGITFSTDEFERVWRVARSEWQRWEQPMLWSPSLSYDREVGFRWIGRITELLGGEPELQLRALDSMY